MMTVDNIKETIENVKDINKELNAHKEYLEISKTLKALVKKQVQYCYTAHQNKKNEILKELVS